LSGYIFATKACIDNRKNMLNTNTSSTCPPNMVNFGPLTAEIGWRVSGFNGFRVLASLLHRRRSTEVNKTLHLLDGTIHNTRCKIHFASKSCGLLYWQRYCTAHEHWASANEPNAKLRCGIFTREGGHPVRHWAVDLSSIHFYFVRKN